MDLKHWAVIAHLVQMSGRMVEQRDSGSPQCYSPPFKIKPRKCIIEKSPGFVRGHAADQRSMMSSSLTVDNDSALGVVRMAFTLLVSGTRRQLLSKKHWRGLEMAQWLRARDALPEDPGSVPSTHPATHNHL